MSLIADLLAWLQGGLQGLGEAVSLRVREEPVLTVGLFRAAIAMLVGFGLGWSGEQVALMVAFIEAITAWVARRQVTPMVDPQLASRGSRSGCPTARRRWSSRPEASGWLVPRSAPVAAARPTLASVAGRRRTSAAATAVDVRASPTASGARPTIPCGGRQLGDALRSEPSRIGSHVMAGGCPGWHRQPHPVRPGELAADHPVPLVLGGEPLPARPGVLCASCNARKGLSQRRR